MTPSASRTRDAARSKAAILDAARDVFVEAGFSGARTGEITKRAGVPQGLLYHYFESKEALFEEVLNQSLRPYFEETYRMLAEWTGEPSPDLLAGAIRLYFDFLTRNPHVPRLMAWWYADQGWSKGQLLVKDMPEHDSVTELGAQRLEEAKAAGFLRPEIDPDALMTMFINLCMHWHITLGWTCAERDVDRGDPDQVHAMNEAHREHIVDVIMHGVMTPDAARGWDARHPREGTSSS